VQKKDRHTGVIPAKTIKGIQALGIMIYEERLKEADLFSLKKRRF